MKHASTLLAQGRYDIGWREHEWRYHSASLLAHYRSRLVPFPKWDGSSLAGRTLLIHPEQGIGEEVMFASCYSDAIAAARHVVIECDPRLKMLFSRSFPSATLIECARWLDFSWADALPPIDFRIPAGSLPRFFRREAADFPSGAYLKVDSACRQTWRKTLDRLGGSISIGISWSGGKDPRAAKARSLALAEWRPIFDAIDANFIDIQYGDHTKEIEAFNHAGARTLHSLPGLDLIKRPDEAMALIAALDLVISIDNSTVFMAGSIGTPVWVLLPPNGEWRWRGRDDRLPWYADARVFRQSRPGIDAWRAVVHRVAEELKLRAGTLRRELHDIEVASPPQRTETSRSSNLGRALLVNDTRSWYHWGCSCTSLAIHEQLRRRWSSIESVPISTILQLAERPTSLAELDDDATFERFAAANGPVIEQIQRADRVYVNGEGTLHGVTVPSLGLLYLAYIAKRRFNRSVHLINHSAYPDDTLVAKESPTFALYRHVYQAMDFVAIREPLSAKLMRDLGIAVTDAFDCLPLFVRQHADDLRVGRAHRDNSVVIAGSAAWGASAVAQSVGKFILKLHDADIRPVVLIGADAHLAADDVQFASILESVAGGRFELINATSELEWLRTIGGAQALVSGRFHHTIAAACLDTPFLLMESNTPKIAGLLQRLQSNAFVSIRESNLADVLYENTRALLCASAHVAAVSLEQLALEAERNFIGP